MKCLSVRQPWADAIIKGIPVPAGRIFKDVENRSKAYGHRGKTLIHAPQKFDHDGWKWIMDTFDCVLPNPEDYQLGGFIGEVTITDCIHNSKSKWAQDGQNHLLLKDPVDLPFMETKGQLGFWNEPTCRVCGCTTYHACERGCYWVEKDLCSECHKLENGSSDEIESVFKQRVADGRCADCGKPLQECSCFDSCYNSSPSIPTMREDGNRNDSHLD